MKLFNTRKVFLRRDYDELVIDQPYDLVPNYVSPFIVNKNK